MIVVRAMILIVVCLALQAGLAKMWASSLRYVDLLSIPVIWYATARSQRAGMLAGCVSGLFFDAWFRAGVFGLGGFIKTFLGWAIGAVGGRIDLNSGPSRFVTTFVFVWLHGPLEIGLLRLLDQITVPPSPVTWTIRALLTGLLVLIGFPILERVAPEQRELDYSAAR